MAIRRTGSQTLVNRGVTAAAATPVNIITGSGGGGATVNISSIQIANSTFVVKDDTAIDTAGGFMIINGTGFQSGAVVYIQGTAATSTAFVSSSRLNVTVPALSSGLLDVYVVNTDGSGSIYLRSLNANGTPSWTTTSPLTTQDSGTAFAINLVASGAAGDGTITYAVSSGSSLPSGTFLASNGYFYGTVSVGTETTYSFSVDAIDAQNQETARSFNITVQIPDPYFNLTTLLLSGNGTNNANNNVFQDSSTNNFTITRNGNTTQGTFSPFSQTGWSNFFDGTGDYLQTASGSSTSFGAGDFCVECWFYKTSSTATGGYLVANLESNSDAQWALMITGTGLIRWQGWNTIWLNPSAPAINQWNHVAVCRSGTTLSLFVNGSRSATLSSHSNNYSATTDVRVGAYASGTDPFTGYISNARVIKGSTPYDPTLTTLTVPTAPLTAITNTSLLTCQSNRFIDNSTNGFAITRHGDVSVQAFSPFAPTAAYSAATVGGSGFFDGTGDFLRVPSTGEGFSSITTFTYECWIYPTSALTTNCIFDISECQPFRFVLSSSNVVWQATSSGSTILTATFTWIIGAWHHVVFVRDVSGNISIFINGTRYATANYGSWGSTGVGGVNIGCNRGDTWFFPGFISNARFVKGTAVYTGAFTPPTRPLSASGADSASAYPSTSNVNTSFAASATSLFLNFTNAGVVDSAAKNVLETVGNARISTTQSKFGGSSMYFDGTGDYLKFPSSELVPFASNEKFTIEGWIYPSAATAGQIYGIYTTRNSGISAYAIAITLFGSPLKINVEIATSGSALVTISSSTTISANTWYHFAVVHDGTQLKLYLNGTSEGTPATTSQATTLKVMALGRYYVDIDNYYFNGYIDDFRITKGYARYTSNFTPPTSTFLTK